MKTRKIVIGMHSGFAGTDAHDFYEVPCTMSNAELDDFAWQCGKDHAEMYGIYPREEYSDEEDLDTYSDSYSDNIDGWWEDYDAKKHDKYSHTGTPTWNSY